MGKLDTLRRIDGLFVGMLDAEEVAIFKEACRRQEARKVYEGSSGLLGLAKVKITTPLSPAEREQP